MEGNVSGQKAVIFLKMKSLWSIFQRFLLQLQNEKIQRKKKRKKQLKNVAFFKLLFGKTFSVDALNIYKDKLS